MMKTLPIFECTRRRLLRLGQPYRLSTTCAIRSCNAQKQSCQYDQPGPHGTAQISDSYNFIDTGKGRCGRALKLKITATFPVDTSSAVYPVALLINGFQCRASWYRSYAVHLASWGYVVLQYDTPALHIIADTVEIACIEELLDEWLRKQNDEPGPLSGRVDLASIALAGHSRGGKLAALLYAGSARFKAAFLIDPVDNTRDAPEGPMRPNACKALKASRKPVGIMGAGIVGPCNPEGSNYKDFYRAAAAGSWLAVVKEAGHQQFMDAGWALNKGFDWLCKCGADSRTETAMLTRTLLVAWLAASCGASCTQPAPQATQAPLDAFFVWVQREEAAGKINFEMKGEGQRAAPVPGGFRTVAVVYSS